MSGDKKLQLLLNMGQIRHTELSRDLAADKMAPDIIGPKRKKYKTCRNPNPTVFRPVKEKTLIEV